MENQQAIIEKIRLRYTENKEKEVSKLEELKNLDKKVKRPAQIFAYTFGAGSSLVLGTGMSLAMKVIGSGTVSVVIGIIIGIIGIIGCSVNYPIYNKMLKKGKEKYAFEIVELARQICEEEK